MRERASERIKLSLRLKLVCYEMTLPFPAVRAKAANTMTKTNKEELDMKVILQVRFRDTNLES